MINNIRPNYINPLTMMKNNKQAKPLSLDKAEEKIKSFRIRKTIDTKFIIINERNFW